jgi:hypothetical protein
MMYGYLSLGWIVISLVVGLAAVFYLLRAGKETIAWKIVLNKLPFFSTVILISASNIETLWLIPWDLESGGDQLARSLLLYQGFPFKIFVKAGIFMRLVEDIPQLATQSAYALQYGADPATVASLLVTGFDLLLKLIISVVLISFGHLAFKPFQDEEPTTKEEESAGTTAVNNPAAQDDDAENAIAQVKSTKHQLQDSKAEDQGQISRDFSSMFADI